MSGRKRLSDTEAISRQPFDGSCAAGLRGTARVGYRRDRDFDRALDRAFASGKPLPSPIPRQGLRAGDSGRDTLNKELKK